MCLLSTTFYPSRPSSAPARRRPPRPVADHDRPGSSDRPAAHCDQQAHASRGPGTQQWASKQVRFAVNSSLYDSVMLD